jgi:hypothetical protein
MAEEKINKPREEKINQEVGAASQRCFFDCRPVIMDAVCACGEKCFHEASYLFKDSECCPIPPDACPISCIVTNLKVNTDKIRRITGTVSGSKGCFQVSGCYDVRAVFEIGTADVRMAKGTFDFTVNVPIDTDYGCVLCNGTETDFCVITRAFQCISADLVEVDDNVCRCEEEKFAIKVVVEKKFFVVEQGETLICLPVCPTQACDCIPPGPVAGAECIPFRKEPTCEEWCFEDDMECPNVCSRECPPEQTDLDECIETVERMEEE